MDVSTLDDATATLVIEMVLLEIAEDLDNAELEPDQVVNNQLLSEALREQLDAIVALLCWHFKIPGPTQLRNVYLLIFPKCLGSRNASGNGRPASAGGSRRSPNMSDSEGGVYHSASESVASSSSFVTLMAIPYLPIPQ